MFLTTGRFYEADGTAVPITIDGHETWGYRVWSLVRGSVRVRGFVCAVMLTPQAAVNHADTLNAAVDAEEATENNDTNSPDEDILTGVEKETDQPTVRVSNNPLGAGPNHKSRPDRCSVCGKEGHKKPTCTVGNTGRSCSVCGYAGHDRRTCTAEVSE
jgi:hypothetical protein